MTARRTSRRDFLKTAVAGASAAVLPLPAIAQSAGGRVVVVGGGFGGATCARFIRRIDPRIAVTLVEEFVRNFALSPLVSGRPHGPGFCGSPKSLTLTHSAGSSNLKWAKIARGKAVRPTTRAIGRNAMFIRCLS